MIPKFGKKLSSVCRTCRDESIDKTLHFDQYSHLSIRLNIFRLSANNSKKNSKFKKSFPLACRACQDKSIYVYKRSLAIRLKIVVKTDRQME